MLYDSYAVHAGITGPLACLPASKGRELGHILYDHAAPRTPKQLHAAKVTSQTIKDPIPSRLLIRHLSGHKFP